MPTMRPLQLPSRSSSLDRADVWAVIGALLLRPSVPLLSALAQAPTLPGAVALADAWQGVVFAVRSRGAPAVQREHADLFVAVGTPLVDPFASLYQGQFLMDRTLARLRTDLQALGQVRQRGAPHTEDHLGALCETMRLLIAGAAGCPARSLPEQQRFFAAHLLPWACHCLQDIRQAHGANFYAALATFFQGFMDQECLALGLETLHPPELHDALPA